MTRQYWKNSDRLRELEALLLEGKTMTECALHFGISKERVSQVMEKFLPHLSRETVGASLKLSQRKQATKARKAAWQRAAGYPESFDTPLAAAQAAAYCRKRAQAKRGGRWDFTIKLTDLDWPETCPVLGIPIDWYSFDRNRQTPGLSCGPRDNSPSFDRLDSARGYVPGNVRVISFRANRIKNDGTAEEHLAIARWMAENI